MPHKAVEDARQQRVAVVSLYVCVRACVFVYHVSRTASVMRLVVASFHTFSTHATYD